MIHLSRSGSPSPNKTRLRLRETGAGGAADGGGAHDRRLLHPRAGELKQRLADWRSLRDRATKPEPIPGGQRLTFGAEAPIEPIAQLAALESECCAFYTFTLRVDGPARQLEIRRRQPTRRRSALLAPPAHGWEMGVKTLVVRRPTRCLRSVGAAAAPA